MTTTSDSIAAASGRIHDLGSLFYFVPETLELGKEHGLDGFRWYFLGRGGVLGDVEPPVVGSAFGYWHPGLVEKIWKTAQERADVSPREAARIYLACAADYGRRTWSNVAGLEPCVRALEKVLAAADPAGLHLFSGYIGEPLVDDLAGRASQLISVLREHMGSAHLVAVLAVGLEPRVAHGVRRPEMYGYFGWRDDAPAATPETQALLVEADLLTQRLIAPAYQVLDDSELDAVVTTLVAMEAASADDIARQSASVG